MSQNPRIEELRRRVQADPASIAFAALAEEYRREGNFTDAIDTCVAGLKRHPSYLSAHVTLGRSLIEVGRFEEAEQELQLVLRAAPENLAAIRGMAEIHHRRRDLGSDEASALSALQHHEQEEASHVAAAAAAAAEHTIELPSEPPPFQAPAFEPPVLDTPAFDPAAYEPAAYEPAAFTPPAFDPPQYEAPRYDPPHYETPQYDPPGTFEFPTASVPTYEMAASEPLADSVTYVSGLEAAAAVVDDRRPEVEALERFLDAITASRTAIPAH